MSARVRMPRMKWTAIAVALVSFAAVSTPDRAQASCGDWLDHTMRPLTIGEVTSSQADSAPLLPKCRGPQCGGDRTPLSAPQPREAPRITELSAVLARLQHTHECEFSGLTCTAECEPLSGLLARIERPPRTF